MEGISIMNLKERELLLKRTELEKIHGKVKTKGVTIIPLRLFVNEKGKLKVEIAVAKSSKKYLTKENL